MNNNFFPLNLENTSNYFQANLENSSLMFSEHHQDAIGNSSEKVDLETWENTIPKSIISRMAEPTKPNVQEEWIQQFGSSRHDRSNGIATDSSGNIYLTGNTNGNLAGEISGAYDTWIAKYDSGGNQIWAKQFGSGWEESSGIATDSTGNVYLTGSTDSDLEGKNAGGYDIWVAKYDNSGNQQWIQQFGSSKNDSSYSIATDSSGNIYVTGSTGGDLVEKNAGSDDIWVAKYDNSGNQQWIQQLGSSQSDKSYGIATDSSNNIYLTGETGGNLEGTNPRYSGDAWIAKYDGNGNKQWIRQFGSSDHSDESYGITTDKSGNVYLTGSTGGNLAGQKTGIYDAWVAKYNSSGNQIWAEQFGFFPNQYYSRAITTDSSGNIFLTGHTNGNHEGEKDSSHDGWIANYDNSGNQQWIQQFGTSLWDSSDAIATDTNGNIYLTGVTDGNLGVEKIGYADVWVAKFTQPKPLNLPTITIATTDPLASEKNLQQTTNPGEFTITRTGNIANPLTVNYAVVGAATNGTDYTKLPGSVTIPAGKTQTTVSLNAIDDATSEYAEKATLVLADNNAYTLGTAKSATVTIADNDKQVVSIKAIDADAAETATGKTPNPGRFRVRRAGNLTNSLTVSYKVDGTAIRGYDYGFSSTIVIPAGKDSVELPMKIIDDLITETQETATITLVAKTNYKISASASSGKVTITDND